MHDAVTRPTPPTDAAPWRAMPAVKIGNTVVGGGRPVVVQSMTNTDTADIAGSVKQVAELWRAGSEMVRLTSTTQVRRRHSAHPREAGDAMGIRCR